MAMYLFFLQYFLKNVIRTSEAQKRFTNKHIQPQLKFKCSYKRNIYLYIYALSLSQIWFYIYRQTFSFYSVKTIKRLPFSC